MHQSPSKLSCQYPDPPRGNLSSTFSERLTDHLVHWKQENITKEQGTYQNRKYDTLLPDNQRHQFSDVYPPIREEVTHRQDFQVSKISNHVADPAVATINLFYPILRDTEPANQILRRLNPSFSRLATKHLEGGFQFNFIGSLTPVDLAIVYIENQGQLALWQIKHVLLLESLPTCTGYRSYENRGKASCRKATHTGIPKHCHLSTRSEHILWEISAELGIRAQHFEGAECPFLENNQLWLLTLQERLLRSESAYRSVHTSILLHPENQNLHQSISEFQSRLPIESMTAFSSTAVINAVRATQRPDMEDWIDWYTDHYMIP